MVNCCCVTGCKNESYPGSRFSFHGFPKNENMKLKWQNAVPGKISKSSVVCSEHFNNDDFIPGYMRKMLKPDAVPSIFPKVEMGSEANNQIIVRRNKKVIIVESESGSDSSFNDCNTSNNELPEITEEIPRKRRLQCKKFSDISAAGSQAISDDYMHENETGTSTADHLLTEILKVSSENQKLLQKFVEQQTELIKLATEVKKQLNRNNTRNVTAISDEEDLYQSDDSYGDTNEHGENSLITAEQHSTLMLEKQPSKLITKAAYIVWGLDELARRSVRFQKNVTERPLSPVKKKVVKSVFWDWMTKNHWPRDAIEDELSRTKMNKYFNGAITAARKRINYKQSNV